MNALRENMRLIAECSQKLVRLGENLFAKGVADEETKPKDMGEELRKCKSDFKYWVDNYIILPDGYVFKDGNGNLVYANKIILEKKKKEFPKTYEECLKILNIPFAALYIQQPPRFNYKLDLLHKLQTLLICRDAYWKLYGEEMGLGKPWEPPYGGEPIDTFCLQVYQNRITKVKDNSSNHCILTFPTEEMRDAFYENFKEEIEICKELL